MSTFLTLLLVPAYFSIAIDIETWIGRKLGRRLSATAHEVPDRRRAEPPRAAEPFRNRRSEPAAPVRLLSGPDDSFRTTFPLKSRSAGRPGMKVVGPACWSSWQDCRADPRAGTALPVARLRRRSPKRRWSAAWPTGSRSPPCSAIRSACRSRIPRSSRATRTGSATRWPSSSATISSSRRRRAAHARHRRRRRGGAFPPRPLGRRHPHAPRRLAPDRRLFEALDDERLGGMVKGAIRSASPEPKSRHCSAPRSPGDRGQSPRPTLEAAIRALSRALDANESLIRDMVKRRASWVLASPRWTKSSQTRSSKACEADARTAHRPRPPDTRQDGGSACRSCRDLQHNPETRARVEQWKEEPSPTARSRNGWTACGKRAAPRSSPPRATPTRRLPGAWAKCCARPARPSKATPGSAARSTSSFAAPRPAWQQATAARSSA